MNTLSFEMMSANSNDWCETKLYQIIQATENVKDLIVCHFIKLNELMKRINIFKKQSQFRWVESKQKVAMNAEFYSYLKQNTKILNSQFDALNKDFLVYKDSIDQFKANASNHTSNIDNVILQFYSGVTLDSLLNNDELVMPNITYNEMYKDIQKYEQKSTSLSLDILDNTYQYNFDLFSSVKSSQDGIFSEADTIIKDMRKQF